jgi:hypothetical protein
MKYTSFVRCARVAAGAVLVALLSACAHPISVTPAKTPERIEAQLIPKKVAYAMTDAERGKEVVTPGGGGDKVSYYPYRDLEKAIRDALRAAYQDVVVVRSAKDATAVRESGAVLVFTPEIKTTSSSPSPFTWPPTRFSSEIICIVTDAGGQEVTRVSATGNGAAEFDEFKSNFSLASQRAGTEVATQLRDAIRSNDKLR